MINEQQTQLLHPFDMKKKQKVHKMCGRKKKRTSKRERKVPKFYVQLFLSPDKDRCVRGKYVDRVQCENVGIGIGER